MPDRKRMGLRIGLAVAVGAAAITVGVAWAVASHPGASPDDNTHLASTWCAWGQEASGCELGEILGSVQRVRVPALEQVMSPCTRFVPDISAACIAADPEDAPAYPGVANLDAYPRGYYSISRLLVGSDTVRSILSMRIVSYLLSVTLILLAGLLLESRERWRAWWHCVVLSVPAGLFFLASNNPSGPAIAASAAVAAAAYAIGRQRSRIHVAAASVLALAGVLIAGQSRPDGWQFATMALCLGALASLRTPSEVWHPGRLIPWAVVFAAAVTTWLGAGKTVTAGYEPAGDAAAMEPTVSVFSIVLEIPKLYVGEFATSLGWLDTPMPAITWGLMALSFGAIVSLGVSGRPPFRSLSLVIAATAMVVIPAYLQLSVDEPVGVWVQPRYLLPLVLTLGVILALKPAEARPITVTQVALVSLLVITAHTWALHRTIRRSVTGVDVEGLDLSDAAEWWWNTSIGPNLVWATGSVAFAALLVVLGVMVLRSQSAAFLYTVADNAIVSATPPSRRDAPNGRPPVRLG